MVLYNIESFLILYFKKYSAMILCFPNSFPRIAIDNTIYDVFNKRLINALLYFDVYVIEPCLKLIKNKILNSLWILLLSGRWVLAIYILQ